MALTFPLSLAQVNDLLFIEDGMFTPARNDILSGLGNNQPLHAELISPLWQANISSGPILNDDAEALIALLEVLERPGNDFYLCNPRKLAPREDPTGSILGAATPIISSIAVNNRQISITGLPANYVLSQGDVVSFDYGPTGQKRRAFHRFTQTMTASAGGAIVNIDVFPHIRSGAVAGDALVLVKANMRAKIVPGSYGQSGAGGIHERISFKAIQKLI